MPWTDDPLEDFHRHDLEQREWLENRPRCIHCKDHIGDEEAYFIEEEWVCECCISRYKRKVE